MQRGLERFGRPLVIHFDQKKKQSLVILALVSPRRNRRSRAQTSIFTIENQHFLVQMAPQASWPRDVPAESLEARSPQPGVLSQASSARIPQPGVLSKDSSARRSQSGILSQESSASSLQPICLGSALESFLIGWNGQKSRMRNPPNGNLRTNIRLAQKSRQGPDY